MLQPIIQQVSQTKVLEHLFHKDAMRSMNIEHILDFIVISHTIQVAQL